MDKADWKLKFKALRCCVLIPTYNNRTTIAAVLSDVLQYCEDVCVVNDGSTDDTLNILQQFPQIKLHSYSRNVGKGWALRQGFEFARGFGYDYAITLDSDGQHFADDLPVMLDALEHHPHAIVIGARNMNQSSVPGKSSFGNKFSNFWFTLETGISVPDTQSGYRLYPLKALQHLHFFTRKYEFEIEVIVRGAWSGIDVKAVPVRVYYPPAEERITHFRPFKDFSRISVLNTVLVFWTFAYIKPRDFIRHIIKNDWRTLLESYLIRSHETPAVKAWSMAVGVFFGITPFWGFQIWFVIFFAWLFRLNKGLSILASNISIPPMIPFIVFASFECGRIWTGGHSMSLSFRDHFRAEMIGKNVLQYVVGSFTLAAIVAIVTWFVTYFVVHNVKQVKNKRMKNLS
jgi:glycosyltransferase involved in cell wall biosynthesis